MEATQNPRAIVKGGVEGGLTQKFLGVYIDFLGYEDPHGGGL
jgi:hypothetical protein